MLNFISWSSGSPGKADKKKSVAKKSTTPGSSLHTGQVWEAGWMKKNKEEKKPKTAAPGRACGT